MAVGQETRATQTIIAAACRLLRERVRTRCSRANAWRRRVNGAVRGGFGAISEWMLDCKLGLITALAVIVWLALMIWFIVDAAQGKVEGSAVQVGVGGLIGGAIVGLIVSPIVGTVAFVLLLTINWSLRLAVSSVLVLSVLVWTPLYTMWRVLVLGGQLLMLIPLVALFFVTRAVQVWKGIFWTCPSRGCSYRGLPAYVCPVCEGPNDRLWPNLYGVFHHECMYCGERLPTLGIGGRRTLRRQCGSQECRMPLTGKHAGRVPERLIAIAGGSGSGKTNYMLMAIHDIISQKTDLSGEIDEPEQHESFTRDWERLNQGMAAGATVEVLRAFLLYVAMGRSRFQLYIYDAPGEEFETLAGMNKQQYFSLTDGFILMVDPESFQAVREQQGLHGPGPTPLDDVVAATLMKGTAEAPVDKNGNIDMRVAVVISKADLPAVVSRIGDIRQTPVDADTCRRAIVEWGGGNAIQGLENRFQAVEYFACSALGRQPEQGPQEAFVSWGVTEPISWLLSK